MDNLPRSGVDCSRIVVLNGESTGVAPITVAESNGENSIIVISGANMGLNKNHFDLDLFRKAKIVVCQNEISHQTNKDALELAKKMGLTTIYSAAPCPTVDEFNSIVNSIDYLIANQIESQQLTGLNSIEQAASELSSLGIGNVIITLGFV